MTTEAMPVWANTYDEHLAIIREVLRRHSACRDDSCNTRRRAFELQAAITRAKELMEDTQRVGVGNYGTMGCEVGRGSSFTYREAFQSKG